MRESPSEEERDERWLLLIINRLVKRLAVEMADQLVARSQDQERAMFGR